MHNLTVSAFVIAIIVGAVIGVLGRLALPGRQNISMIATVLVGIVAAIVGTLIAGALHVRHTDGIDWIQLFIQVILAAVGVALISGSGGRRRRRI
jgi:uncharacterized membrane protein YeaQ/YmgE (transglycosylase-associated protein family)